MSSQPNYPAIIVALIEHFGNSEGTDHLSVPGEAESDLDASVLLSDIDYMELTRLRDLARANRKRLTTNAHSTSSNQ